jgi:Flp pilus assembly protein TadD
VNRTTSRYGFERASLLRAMGAFEQAKQEYLDVVRRMPGHLGALNDLGTMLYEAGYCSAARVAYAEAVRHHPDDVVVHINLANLLLATDDPVSTKSHRQPLKASFTLFVYRS